jgi:hypothetical protein
MKSRSDAERVVALCDERDDLCGAAGAVRGADKIAVTGTITAASRSGIHRAAPDREESFRFVHLTDELRALVGRELGQQTAKIDEELKHLGVALDEFDAAAPEAAEKTMAAGTGDMQGATKVAETELGNCIKAFTAWNEAGEACAEKSKAYANEGTAESRQALVAAAQARAKAREALSQARLHLYAAVHAEFVVRAPR